jgi:hypothetical protein
MDSVPEVPREPAESTGPDPTSGPVAAKAPPVGRLAALRRLIRAIADVDPVAIERAARRLGGSRRILTPLAWTAGTVVLLIRGVKLLILNWRLSLIQLVPAAWVWLATWDLKRHLLHEKSFLHLHLGVQLVLAVVVVLISVAAFWCNAVFAFAIDGPPPPRIAPAVRQARRSTRMVVLSGLVVGGALAFATIVVPRIAGPWVFSLVLSVVLGVMLISFVAVPARIIGVKKQKLPPTEALSRVAVSGTLSAVAMTPGFLLDRLGLILLGFHHFHIIGFAMLSIGTALYAAGMSSVKAVKLTMKLTPDDSRLRSDVNRDAGRDR